MSSRVSHTDAKSIKRVVNVFELITGCGLREDKQRLDHGLNGIVCSINNLQHGSPRVNLLKATEKLNCVNRTIHGKFLQMTAGEESKKADQGCLA